MKRYRSYNGDKPYIFATCTEPDEHHLEAILDKLVPLGYRIRIENKSTAYSETLCELEKAHVVFLVLTERFISDAQCSRSLQKAEESHKPLLIYAPEETAAVNEYMMRLQKTPETAVIIHKGEEDMTASRTVEALLDETLGLIPTLATKVFRKGARMVESKEDSVEGMNLIRLAASENCAEALLWLGKNALDLARAGIGGYEKAVEHLLDAARLGSTEASLILGRMLKDGEGFECDPQLAYTYILRSAQYGYPQAQTELAEMYDHGIGTEQDKVLATKWYLTAAEKGEPGAYLPLAARYLDGVYIEKDEQLAEEYLTKSSESGSADAELILAKLFRETAIATGQGFERSEEHFKKAAEAGLSEAQYLYALTLLSSKKHRRKERNRLAFYWLMRASEDRIDGTAASPDAMYQLGLFYQKGRGCKRDPQKAFISFYSAARLGHTGALAAVSECYKKGIGVPKNKKASVLFKKRALRSGYRA